jgi:phosphoribosylpyrophosphate synthetase
MSISCIFDTTNKVLVVSTPKMKESALALVALKPERMEYYEIQWSTFPDKTPSTILDAARIRGRDVVLVCDIAFDHVLQLCSAMYAIPRYFARTFNVFVGFFPCGTMERVQQEGELASAKTVARLLSVTPAPLIGLSMFHIFDMHALASRFFFEDSVHVNFVSGVPVLLRFLAEQFAGKTQKPVVAFPDDGAYKRFKLLIPSSFADRVVFAKQRVGDQRVLSCAEGSEFIQGRDIIIVDDIANSGGTLVTCADHLQRLGANNVRVYTTHAIFPMDEWKQLLPATRIAQGKKPLGQFITTATNPATTAVLLANNVATESGEPFFRVLPIAPVIAAALGFVPLEVPASVALAAAVATAAATAAMPAERNENYSASSAAPALVTAAAATAAPTPAPAAAPAAKA